MIETADIILTAIYWVASLVGSLLIGSFLYGWLWPRLKAKCREIRLKRKHEKRHCHE